MHELERLDLIEREAWAAWEQSKKASLTRTASGGGNGRSETLTQATRDPKSSFLDTILRCFEDRSRLMGITSAEPSRRILNGLPDAHIERILTEHFSGCTPMLPEASESANGCTQKPH